MTTYDVLFRRDNPPPKAEYYTVRVDAETPGEALDKARARAEGDGFTWAERIDEINAAAAPTEQSAPVEQPASTGDPNMHWQGPPQGN